MAAIAPKSSRAQQPIRAPTPGTPPLEEVAAFVAVAEAGGFTQAARHLGTTKSSLGKAVQRLEARLGARLLARSTRQVALTEDGALYLDAARTALGTLDEAGQALAVRQGEPAGRLRVDLPAGLGRLVLPTLAGFCIRHPKVSVEAAFSDRYSDPVVEGWDVVVRIGPLADGDILARRLCGLVPTLYAAPDYLAAKGVPQSIPELRTHDAVVFRGPDGRLRPWLLQEGGRPVEVSPSPRLVVSDGQALLEAAAAGLGVTRAYDLVAAPLVAAGR